MVYSDIKNQVIMITGAAGGIGKGLCERFDSLGARVYSTDLASVNKAGFMQGDISDQSVRASWVQDVLDEEGRIDVLANNAGICPRTALSDVTLAEWNKVLDINLTSTFILSQLVIESMIGRGSGVIINLASLAGKVGGIAVGAATAVDLRDKKPNEGILVSDLLPYEDGLKPIVLLCTGVG